MKTAPKMTFAQSAADRVARANRIARWAPAMEAMREKTSASTAAFCKVYDLNETQINHIMAGRRGASWETIAEIDHALNEVLGSIVYPLLDYPHGTVKKRITKKD